MTKKFLAVTLVLVLVAGVGALAATEEDRPLTGEWENTLTLDMNQEAWYLDAYSFDSTDNIFYSDDSEGDTSYTGVTNPFIFNSDLSLTYESGGLTYEVDVALDYNPAGMPSGDYPGSSTSPPYWQSNGLTDMEFGVSTSVGLLDLSSTVNFDPVDKDLDYWKSSASLTLGGVSITDTFVLQPVMQTNSYTAVWEDPATEPDGYSAATGSSAPWEASDTLGAGMNLMFSGETPGGVSVTVENLFGMEKVMDTGTGYTSFFTKNGLVSDIAFGLGSIPYTTGYNILTTHEPGGEEVYGASSMQYVMSILTLENMSLGCCDFSSETVFSEAKGFNYTKFDFTIESTSLPISLDATLKFTEQTKSIHLVPSITTDWACFTVYSGLTPDALTNNSTNVSVIDGFEIRGFAITDVELGHVKVSSYTALGGNTLNDMVDAYMFTAGYDELIRIEKLEEYPLDFTLDTYFNMSASSGIFDLAEFDGTMEYKIDDEFTIGTGVVVEPNGGLQSFDFTFDYSF